MRSAARRKTSDCVEKEQATIPTVLSDMYADIDALEARLAKTRDLKRALLTGRIRLPLDEAA